MSKKGITKVGTKGFGYAVVALGGMYAAITKDFKIGSIIIAVGGMIVAAGEFFP
jgi:hypothetical protein